MSPIKLTPAALILAVLCGSDVYSQTAPDTLVLTLQQVTVMAQEKSIMALQASTTQKTKYWEYRTFRSNYQPQLSMDGTLPNYNKTFAEVLQPDGSILFQPIHNNNSALSLSFSQSISTTGTTIFGTTRLQRFDDFERDQRLYNGIPFGVGIQQPLFQFNQLKWDRRIEPLKYAESKQEYIESMENISVTACGYYFDLLMAQVNFQAAETNLNNTEKIMRIADEKFQLGRISRNEILQLQLEQLKAQKAIGVARRDIEIATLNLRSFTGLQDTGQIALKLPPAAINMSVTSKEVLDQAYANRSDAIAFQRRIAEAKRDVAKAKGDNGLNAMLTAQLGFSKSAVSFNKVYQSPQDQQMVSLSFTIPILDWGRSKARTKTAEANLEFISYAVKQDEQIFVQEIITQVTLFDMMKDQLTIVAMADSIASEKYNIAKERYVLGNLSITDLSISFQEKDQSKRDNVTALRNLWGSYFQLRYLSLYDFEKHEKIRY
jgi:outer membrane protein TolC